VRGGATFSSSMDAAEAQQRADVEEELAESALRQAEIKRRIAEAEQKLKDRELARKGKRGRMKVNEQTIENNLHALLVRLRRGYLPGEVMSTPSAPPTQVSERAAEPPTSCCRRSSAMRKENIDHFFKYGTFPYGEWFEGSNKAAGKLPVATTLSLLDTVVVTRRRRRVTSFAFPSGGAPTGRVYRQYLQRR